MRCELPGTAIACIALGTAPTAPAAKETSAIARARRIGPTLPQLAPSTETSGYNAAMPRLLALLILACPLFSEEAIAAEDVYSCPMHPEVRSDKPGPCPICGMEMVLQDALAIPHARMGSGTAWQPDTTPMRMTPVTATGFTLMLHGAATLGWDQQDSKRGGHQLMSTNWLMAMLSHRLLGAELFARTMLSLEPATIPGAGFPELLQTGEFYQGKHLHDQQHPHDLFMEVALDYRRPLNDWPGLELYGGPSGEPALGPVAFMHRASAQDDPFPPLSHHWPDPAHVRFRRVTPGP